MPSMMEIMAARTPRGGWTRATLAGWGVPWPAPRGWQKKLCKRNATHVKSVGHLTDALLDRRGLIAMFDGACWPNPHGNSTCAATVEQDGVRIATFRRYIGTGKGMSNNVAEFSGLLLILRWLRENHITQHITIMGDSKIALDRMRSRTLPTGMCRDIAQTCLDTAALVSAPITYRWIPRELNADCDELANNVPSHVGTDAILGSSHNRFDCDDEPMTKPTTAGLSYEQLHLNMVRAGYPLDVIQRWLSGPDRK